MATKLYHELKFLNIFKLLSQCDFTEKREGGERGDLKPKIRHLINLIFTREGTPTLYHDLQFLSIFMLLLQFDFTRGPPFKPPLLLLYV